MANIITTLHPENDENINLYPNIKKENIPDGSVDENKLSESVNNTLNSIDTRLTNAIATIQQPKYYSTLPTSDVGLIVYSDGYIYSWNGTQYINTNILYQATQIADNSVSYSKLNTDVKNKFEYLEDNINSFNDAINLYHGKYILGKWDDSNYKLQAENSGNYRIAVIPCKPNTTYYMVRNNAANNFGRIAYTTSDTLEVGTQLVNLVYDLTGLMHYSVTTGADAKYLLFYYTYTGADVFIQWTSYEKTTFNQLTYPLLKDSIYTKEEVNGLIPIVNNKKCKFSKTGNEINIYMPSKNSNNYIRFLYRLVNDSSINFNQWKVMDINVCDASLNILFNLYYGSNNTEWEGVVRETGTTDFIGGYHGDETNESISVMVDGKPLNMSSDYIVTECDEILIVNKSIVNRCDTPNDNLFTRWKVSRWNKDKYTIRNRWIALQNNITLDRIYMTMLSLPVIKDTKSIAQYGRYDDKYIIQDYSGAAIEGSCLYNSNYAREVEFWGNDFYARVKAIYNDYTGYSCFCDRFQINIFKAYFNQVSRTMNTNDELNGLSEYEFFY